MYFEIDAPIALSFTNILIVGTNFHVAKTKNKKFSSC